MTVSADDMSLGLQDLKSHIWDCAEILRGSAVDRTDWKAYILPLLFFKRICDVWDEEAAEATLVYGDVDPSAIERGPPCASAYLGHDNRGAVTPRSRPAAGLK